TSAHHLRLTTEAVRVLNARAMDMRRTDRTAGEEIAIDTGGIDLTAVSAHRMNTRVERRIAAEACVDGQRAGDEGRGQRAFGSEQRSERDRCRYLRTVQKCEPLFGRESNRRE